MNDFFKSSYYFWVVSKIILVVLGFISLIQIFSTLRLSNFELMINVAFLFYLLFLSFVSIKELRGIRTRGSLNVIVGSLSLLIGLALLVTFFILGSERLKINMAIALLFSLWIIFMGLFDLCKQKS